MSKLTLELPESFQRRAARLAALEGMSFEHFVALAVAEKLSALESVELLRREVAGAKREDFERYLAAVPDVPPAENDRLD
ncbi:MAG: carboxypeptidase M32 [Planctomycetes bacterium]|nr:carboxypeptidase M32 [Planctomycetota bacterium]